VLHTTDGGVSWETQNVPVQYSVFSICFIDASNGWLSADYGGIAHTTSGGEMTSVGEALNITAPNRFEIIQNFPNPFNPSTMIQFTVPSNGQARLKIFNMLGQEVATLFDDVATAGTRHQVEFNASNLAGGIYFSRLEFGGQTQIQKMILLK
jgi:Secretion system C-terminal sorting domain